MDNFELAKTQLKLETEGEKRVDAAYQGLYKQMVELFRGMGLEATPGERTPPAAGPPPRSGLRGRGDSGQGPWAGPLLAVPPTPAARQFPGSALSWARVR